MSVYPDHILGPDTHANRPAAADVPDHAQYRCTDHNKTYLNDAGTWIDYQANSVGAVESVVAGTNVTVDNTDPANPIVSASGGGGGGSSIPLAIADKLPTSPNAKDDEFNDATGMSGPFNGLDAKWTRHNFPVGSQSFGKEMLDSVIFSLTGSDSSDASMYQTAPAGDFTIASRLEAKLLNTRQFWGIFIVDSGGNGVCLQTDQQGGDSFKIRNMSAFVATSALQAFPDLYQAQFYAGHPLFMKLAKSGTSYTGTFWIDATSDGSVRSQSLTATGLSFTPAYIGVGRLGVFSGSAWMGVDFFRVS